MATLQVSLGGSRGFLKLEMLHCLNQGIGGPIFLGDHGPHLVNFSRHLSVDPVQGALDDGNFGFPGTHLYM